MILTEPEINKISGGSVDHFDRIVFARAIEAALLEKLRGGVELPAPTARFNWNLGKFEWLVTFKHSEHHLKPLYTRRQLLAYGAAQRLAGREQVLKEATDLDWTAIMCEGRLVTWENAETLGCHAVEHIRALAASPQEQQP